MVEFGSGSNNYKSWLERGLWFEDKSLSGIFLRRLNEILFWLFFLLWDVFEYILIMC